MALSDIDIAQAARLRPILQLAQERLKRTAQDADDESAHISGPELLEGVRELGLKKWDMAAGLVAMGHQVRVVAAPPYYPDWRVNDGWSNRYRRHTWQGVDVWRVPLWVPQTPSGLKRILHLLSFSIAALPDQIWIKADNGITA